MNPRPAENFFASLHDGTFFLHWVVGRRHGAVAVCCGRLSSQHFSLVIGGVEVALRSMDAKAASEPSHWRKSEEEPPLGEFHKCDGATGETDPLAGLKLRHSQA